MSLLESRFSRQAVALQIFDTQVDMELNLFVEFAVKPIATA